jgi:hypothetical protein
MSTAFERTLADVRGPSARAAIQRGQEFTSFGYRRCHPLVAEAAITPALERPSLFGSD